ncbi:hypothetical protein MIB92_14880 [Aestuariirhabdus sp. Z084]|uniref:hypothetical protein n=1 Tax=Aestuariirhabdus haliotis TaxID=2918751 RepID=UPI00201B393B|nr:hypothetical protein [Aestuariirhabdus haliotis]MCL6416944.1 hypothetical protein [Aestuariirhabdus haliotis]MCL6420953.1 hypothetical protein [Aestuariirhabdus haliotis]
MAIALIITSTLLHAGWNSIGKRSATSASFYMWATAAGMLIYSPLLFNVWSDVLAMPTRFWLLILASGLCQMVYLVGLAKAYQGGDLGVVYPLARALPVLIVPLLVLMAYGDTALSVADVGAMALIFCGAMMVPVRRWREWHIKTYFTPAVGWAVVAALGTAGYSFTDSAAIHLMRDAGFNAFEAGGAFAVVQAASIVLCMLPVSLLVLKEPVFAALFRQPQIKRSMFVTGLFAVGTYLLVLISMSMVTEVSYVVALRQLSIPIGVAIGIIWLKEGWHPNRLQGVVIMLVGLVFVSL